MQFYNNSHPFYCGIDLHARSLYVCIVNDKGETGAVQFSSGLTQ